MIASSSASAPAMDSSESWSQVVEQMLDGLRFGTIQLTVHEGRVVQIDRTERRRLDPAGAHQERR